MSVFITHAHNSGVRKAFSGVCDSVCLSVCPHDKTKTADNKITKLGKGIVHHDTSPIGQRSHGQKYKKAIECPVSSSL